MKITDDDDTLNALSAIEQGLTLAQRIHAMDWAGELSSARKEVAVLRDELADARIESAAANQASEARRLVLANVRAAAARASLLDEEQIHALVGRCDAQRREIAIRDAEIIRLREAMHSMNQERR